MGNAELITYHSEDPHLGFTSLHLQGNLSVDNQIRYSAELAHLLKESPHPTITVMLRGLDTLADQAQSALLPDWKTLKKLGKKVILVGPLQPAVQAVFDASLMRPHFPNIEVAREHLAARR